MKLRSLPLAAAVGLLAISAAEGETVTVTTTSDENDGSLDPARGSGISLREALNHGSTPVLIHFDPSLNGRSFPGGNLETDKEVVIDAASLPAGITLFSRNLHILSGADAVINSCRFAGTTHTQVRPLTVRGTATLNDCVVKDYRFTVASGARQGVVANFGTLTLNRCLLENNSSNEDKSGESAGLGGAIYNVGTLEMNDCVLRRNDAGYSGGGVWTGGLGTATIRRSTFTENSAGTEGAAVSSRSRYDFDPDGTVHLFHCTISESFRTSISLSGSSSLKSCTIVDNDDVGVMGSGIMENCIVAGNATRTLGKNAGIDVVGTFSGNATNLIGDPGDTVFTGIPPMTGDPTLSPLGFFGSHTRVYVPLPGSPALAAGEIFEADVDQSGQARPAGVVDLGSVDANALHERNEFERWTYQHLPPGSDQSFLGDPDRDEVPNGFEWGVGTNPFLFDLTSPRHPHTRRGDSSAVEVVFGLNALAAPHLSFRLNRFAGPDEPTVVYELDGATGDVTTAPDIAASSSLDQVIVSDQSPPQPAGYYTLEVVRTVP